MNIINLSKRQFDHYAQKHNYRSYYQTSNYSNLIKNFGYKTEFIGIVNDGNKLIGASLIIYKEVFMKNKIAYAPRGILFDYTNLEDTKELAKELKKFLGKKGFMLLRIDPYIPKTIRNNTGEILNINNNSEDIINNLISSSFTYKGENLFFETEKPRWESLVLLNNDIRDIFSKFDKRTRNKIRKAGNLGVEISKSNNNDVELIYNFFKYKTNKPIIFYKELIKNFENNIEIYYAKINTQNFTINSRRMYETEEINNKELSTRIQDLSLSESERNDILNKKMESDTLLSQYKKNVVLSTNLLKKYPNGLPIAGCIILKYDNAAFLFIEGMNENYQNLNANYLLKWKLIEKFNKEGLKYFNLNAVVGEFNKKNKYSGLNELKLGFNSIVTEYIGEFEIILNNLTYNLYKNLNK